jgi:hypothetical protein
MTSHDLAAMLSSMLENTPQVQVGTHLHHANFLVGNKVFAFIQGDGVALKLPKSTIQALVGAKQAAPLVMGKRTMKEWAIIKHEHPEEYMQDEALFKEAIAFVSSKA